MEIKIGTKRLMVQRLHNPMFPTRLPRPMWQWLENIRDVRTNSWCCNPEGEELDDRGLEYRVGIHIYGFASRYDPGDLFHGWSGLGGGFDTFGTTFDATGDGTADLLSWFWGHIGLSDQAERDGHLADLFGGGVRTQIPFAAAKAEYGERFCFRLVSQVKYEVLKVVDFDLDADPDPQPPGNLIHSYMLLLLPAEIHHTVYFTHRCEGNEAVPLPEDRQQEAHNVGSLVITASGQGAKDLRRQLNTDDKERTAREIDNLRRRLEEAERDRRRQRAIDRMLDGQ